MMSEASLFQRIVKRKGGNERGVATIRKHGYTVKWDGGEIIDCVDLSYIGAELVMSERNEITPKKFA